MIQIKKLTKEQEAKIPEYRDRWIEIGLQTGDADWETFDTYMPICYEKAGLKYPKNVVRVNSPLVGAFASSIAGAILNKTSNEVSGAVDDAIRVAVSGAVGIAVDGAVDVAVNGAVGSAVSSAVGSAVSSAVGSAVSSAVGEAVSVAVGRAVSGAVDDTVGVAVSGAVGRAVGGAVDDAVGEAVSDAVNSAVNDAVYVAVSDAVGVAVGETVGEAVSETVGEAVDGAVHDAVTDAVGRSVSNDVAGIVDWTVSRVVGRAVGDATQTTVAENKLDWHYWLGGQFWVGWYWGPAFVNFFLDVCKLKLSQDIMERALAYRKVCESVNYIWANKDFVMVCARPTHIDRDEQGRLHSQTRMAIQYPDGYGLYMLYGVRFEKDLWEKIVKDKLTSHQILSLQNIEQRMIALKIRGAEKLLQELRAEPIDNAKGYELYKITEGFSQPAYFLKYKDFNSERMYVSGVDPDIGKQNDAVLAVAWKFGLSKEEYEKIIYHS